MPFSSAVIRVLTLFGVVRWCPAIVATRTMASTGTIPRGSPFDNVRQCRPHPSNLFTVHAGWSGTAVHIPAALALFFSSSSVFFGRPAFAYLLRLQSNNINRSPYSSYPLLHNTRTQTTIVTDSAAAFRPVVQYISRPLRTNAGHPNRRGPTVGCI